MTEKAKSIKQKSLTIPGFLPAAQRASTEALIVYSDTFTVLTSDLYFVVD